MYVKVFVVVALLCALQCSVEVQSFEILKNVAEKVGNKIQRIHKALHPHHNYGEPTSTSIPAIDIRFQYEDTDTNKLSLSDKGSTHAPIVGQGGYSTTEFIPTIDSRSIIDAPCANNMQQTADGRCRRVFA